MRSLFQECDKEAWPVAITVSSARLITFLLHLTERRGPRVCELMWVCAALSPHTLSHIHPTFYFLQSAFYLHWHSLLFYAACPAGRPKFNTSVRF